MYAIFFHIGGIAILEICFYFFYIGPIESIIFQRKIKKLLENPSQKVNMFLQNSFFEQQVSKDAVSYFITQEMKDWCDEFNVTPKYGMPLGHIIEGKEHVKSLLQKYNDVYAGVENIYKFLEIKLVN